ncbi:hypothetical protein SUGI_1429900 [Cryptomeria japonica]|uniref:PGG domain-containing protein n=1 Tax=Cryptomeria japonica TaxID=3369 RepID=A0AAD3RP02_CRYJA|nr:hypothetical protein SUGI_1429830 [Cryptomeria japonica]GLJ58298.1 hypothetical protein SUGI_1429860 [Cryptomeria japonica]GLJ58299.1 hypothetical protein SUGI_1429880 [Cryptomeria japonica]GLJ58300.1 hypothetical protein SUGI_1429900 [Cryptomeria japonica]
MEVVEIQDTAPQEEAISVVVDRLPDADLRQNQSPVTTRIKSVFEAAVALVLGCFNVMFAVRRGEEDRRWVVEPANIQTTISYEEDLDSIKVDHPTAPDLQLEQSAVSSDYKSVIQLTVALAFVGGSFGAMYAVPGGVNEAGRAVMGDSIGFIIFLITDMVALLASLLVTMIVATVSEISAKMEYLIRMSLWAAGVSFIMTFHAAAYVVALPKHNWIVLCFGGAVAIALILLLLYRLSTMFHQVSKTSIKGNGGMRFPYVLEGGHLTRDSRRGQLIKKEEKISTY